MVASIGNTIKITVINNGYIVEIEPKIHTVSRTYETLVFITEKDLLYYLSCLFNGEH